jgi:VIT1/CCC1 family predicted Fe2+/Mn2+ transporter
MQTTRTPAGDSRVTLPPTKAAESAVSAVSWPAIIAGAVAIVAVGLILLALGSGLGLSSVSPWPNSGPSATTFGVYAAVWLIVVQWVSAAFGGYLTGRLRTKWVGVHTDEVYLRDTAHGFLAWAVAAVIMAAALSSAASSAVGNVVRATGSVASAAAEGAGTAAAQSGGIDPMGYVVDTLFRSERPDANANPQEARAEASRIILSGLREGDVPARDKTYLAQLVSARTGISQADAEKRVNDVIAKAKDAETKARQAADAVRKTAAAIAFFTAFSMLIGAFIAAVAAVIAGHRRDEALALRI